MHLTAILMFALVAATTAVAGAQQPDSLHFPVVEGESLTGVRTTLPADFAGERNLVFVAFSRGQQADVDTWTPLAKRLVAADSALRSYELPTLARRYRLIRPMIDGGMRRGIADSATRAATITLYIDKSPFERALGIAGEDSIAVLLVARGGDVLWHARGRWTPEAEAALTAVLRPR
jgi:hypothetical protein